MSGTFGWTLVSWVKPIGAEPDSVVWIAPKPGVPERCLCGYPFPHDTPSDATRVTCVGPWGHVWKSLLVELEERIALKTGQTGSSFSPPAEGASTGPESENRRELPDSNKTGS